MSEDEIHIVNEYADVTVRRVETECGNRLEIDSRKGTIRLDATSLECISWQDHDFFTNLLGENPRGPPGFKQEPPGEE